MTILSYIPYALPAGAVMTLLMQPYAFLTFLAALPEFPNSNKY